MEAFIYKYSIKINSCFVIRKERMQKREGLIILIKDGSKIGIGEVSPLPHFSEECLNKAFIEAKDGVVSFLKGKKIYFKNYSPSVSFGLSMAIFEYENGYSSKTYNYDVNLKKTSDLIYDSNLARHIKVKVDINRVHEEGKAIQYFLKRNPDKKIRLDINKGWSLSDALLFAKCIKSPQKKQIEFIEEPCFFVSDSIVFKKETGISLAFDESLREFFLGKESYNLKYNEILKANFWIIKPTLMGSISYIEGIINLANKNDIRIVFSSSLESSIGLSQIAFLNDYFKIKTPPGLDTIRLFSKQLHRRFENTSKYLVFYLTLKNYCGGYNANLFR